LAHDTEQLKAEMEAKVEAILADPEVSENVFHEIVKAAVEVAAGHLIRGFIVDFLKPTEPPFGGGGMVGQRIDGKFTEKIPRPHTSVIRFI
jgi:hypothetical protein